MVRSRSTKSPSPVTSTVRPFTPTVASVAAGSGTSSGTANSTARPPSSVRAVVSTVGSVSSVDAELRDTSTSIATRSVDPSVVASTFRTDLPRDFCFPTSVERVSKAVWNSMILITYVIK